MIAEANGSNGVPSLVPQPHGGALLVGGRKGNRGGGRSADFRERMRKLVDEKETQEYLAACLKGEHGDKVFIAALSYATAYAYGKPPQTLKVEKTNGQHSETGEELVSRVMQALPRLLTMIPGARDQMLEALSDGRVIEATVVEEGGA